MAERDPAAKRLMDRLWAWLSGDNFIEWLPVTQLGVHVRIRGIGRRSNSSGSASGGQSSECN